MERNVIIGVLSLNRLFGGLPHKRIDELLELCDYSVMDAAEETMLSSESEPCKHLGFVLDGKVATYKTVPSGNHIVVKSIERGDCFGEALVFSSSKDCPSTIIAGKNSSVLLVSPSDILSICEAEPVFLKNLLASLSDKVFMLNRKIRLLSYNSVRERLASFLMDEVRKRHSVSFSLDKTREELAELIGVARPSVSRELSNMARDGLIYVDGKRIEVLDIEAMNSLL